MERAIKDVAAGRVGRIVKLGKWKVWRAGGSVFVEIMQ